MDKLAVELLSLISFYACTDGGQTGCALSLVSRRIRAASRSARFFSVTLVSSPAKVEQFLLCYQAERSRAVEALPRVRHLCLSLFGQGLDASFSKDLQTPGGPHAAVGLPARPKTREEFFAAMQRRTQHWRSTQDTLDEQYNRVIPALIRAVAGDVYTIALVQAQWRSTSITDCFFPSLRELTIVGGNPTFLPMTNPGDRPMYPALKRLHHILSYSGRDVDFVQWAHLAPNVTHLRVSRVDADPRITIASFERVIGKLGSTDYGSEDFFPQLQYAVIEPHPAPPPLQTNGTAHLAFREFLSYLEEVKERARVPTVVLPPLVQPKLPPGIAPHQLCITRVKKEWMERVEEGAGCWEEGRDSMQMKKASS